jgi:hypothetical protein
MRAKPFLIRNAAIAALVGITAGGAVGLWTVRDPTPAIAIDEKPAVVATSPAAASEATSGAAKPDMTARDGVVPSIGVGARADARPAAIRPGFTPVESQTLVARARALAERPDVTALVALRESISRRADAAGEQESPATQRLLAEVDRYLTEARQRRLRLDGEALRKSQK